MASTEDRGRLGKKKVVAQSMLKEKESDCSKALGFLPAARVLFLNNTPEAEVPQRSLSLCLGKRNLCLLENLGEGREETVTSDSENCSVAWQLGEELPQKALCIMREEKATQSPQAGNNPAGIVAVF